MLNKTRFDAVIATYGSLTDALPHVGEEFLAALGCKEESIREALMRLEGFDAQAYEERLRKGSVRFLCIADDAYPASLRNLPDPPVFLHAIGDLSLCDRPSVALVGTRQMTKYGQRVTQLLVPDLVAAGLVTVSGLAKGIDAEVARETLRDGGKHIAVLGHGLGTIYPPENRQLAKDVVGSGGLLLTEFPMDFAPSTYTFPGRNRIIAGLSRGTVVLEAPEKSGALLTAEFALEQGKDVFAVPGQITETTFGGCHRLISRGQAKLVTTAAEILEEMGLVASQTTQKEYDTEDPVERAVWKALSVLPVTVDDLMVKTAIDAPTIGAALTMMELSGAVRSVGGGQWVRA